MRTLFLDNFDDPKCFDNQWENSEFFVGPDLLVAPVTEQGKTSRFGSTIAKQLKGGVLAKRDLVRLLLWQKTRRKASDPR